MIPAATTVLADIETTAITYEGGVMVYPSTVHLIIANDYERDTTHVFGPDIESLKEGVDFLERSQTVVFHNGIGFDVPVLEKNFGMKRRNDKHFVDSLVLCQLFYSNVKEEEDFALYEKSKMFPADHPKKFPGNLIGSHSLEAWGLRLKDQTAKKGSYGKVTKYSPEGYDPWSAYSDEMREYAIQDVMVLRSLWTERLRERFHLSVNQEAIAVEHYMAELMGDVQRSGIALDKEHAEKLAEELEAKALEMETLIENEFPPRLEPVKWVYHELPIGDREMTPEDRLRYLAIRSSQEPEHLEEMEQLIQRAGAEQQLTLLMYENADNPTYRPRFNLPEGYIREWYGEVSVPKSNKTFYLNNKKETGVVLYKTTKGDPIVKVQMTPFNPRSRVQIVRRLLEFGWVPEEFTDTGNPSVSEVELHKIEEEFPAAASIAKYLLIQKRLGQIKNGEKAWLKLVDDNGFIHPTIRACNTVAFRATHSDPNISQVPSVKSKDLYDEEGNKVKDENGKVIQRILKGEEGKWGWDCRACFTVPEGFVMVGSDLAGIEMRAWAHYLTPFDNGYFADVVLNKDVHEENRVILGFDDRRKAKEWLYACVPMDTQCLTREGWKTYDQLVVGEDIMTYNPTTQVKEWQPLLETVYYEDAPLIRMSHSRNTGFSLVTTPDHRWFVRKRTSYGAFTNDVKTTEEINGSHDIIVNAPLKEDGAFALADVLTRQKYGGEWLRAVLDMNNQQREAFLAGFLIADGYRKAGSDSWMWCQNEGEFSEAALLASYLAWDTRLGIHYDAFSKNKMIRVTRGKYPYVAGLRLTKEDAGRGPVWCPRTDNGSWVMRQGDCITITGNSMYGAGDHKLGSIIEPHASMERQKAIGLTSRIRFMQGMRGYEQLNEQLMIGVKRGHLKGLDGRRVPVRKSHAALNSLLQSAGAIVSKYWIVFLMDILENELGLKWGYENDFVMMIYSHDEVDLAVRAGLEDKVAEACVRSAKKAGEHLKFRLPVEVGTMIGAHWGECH